MSAPVFAVVGYVNRGKSSVVSTLAADESVAIDGTPGTTHANRAFPMRLGGETLYTLIDTPGFERARHVLAWLREHETTTAERRALVARFVREHTAGGRFPQECELLAPILDGASILYVVDGSRPPTPACEAETEILRWTGAPRMALINPIGAADHSDVWRALLDQYFSLVRVFDAHAADFDNRVALLGAMRELADGGREAIDRAIKALEADRVEKRRESAARIADAISDICVHTMEKRLEPGDDPERHKPALLENWLEGVRRRELRLRSDLRRLYLHSRLEIELELTESVDEDLFDRATWSRLGLSRGQLVAVGASSGALLGGAVDVALGGATLLAGAIVGGAAGAAATWWGFGRIADVEVLGSRLGGALLRAGPPRDSQLAWIVLDRALIFWREVATHAHAARNTVDLAGASSEVQALDPDMRRRIGAAIKRISSGTVMGARADLTEAIDLVLRTREDEH
jgi:hypothetical protein